MNQKSLNFQSQNLVVDWISFKSSNQNIEVEKKKIAHYFYGLGFNSYQIVNSSNNPIFENSTNKVEMFFDNSHKYWLGTILSFRGSNAKYFYELVQDGLIDWKIFQSMVLNRFDIYFSEKIMNKNSETLRLFFQQCETKLEKNSFSFKNNPKLGKILRIGNRRSNRYSRIYQKNTSLRFEYEMKGEFIENFHDLFQSQNLLEFEYEITKNFLTYFAKKLPLDSNYTQWLVTKLRPFRNNSSLPLKTDYITSTRLENLKDEKNLVMFLKFLMYIKNLDYQKEFLGTTSYRCVYFKLRNFLEFQNSSSKFNYYQLNKLKDFIDNLQTNFIIKKFSNRYFQSLVSVPKVNIYKDKREWVAKVWIVDELFYYNYPFLFPDLFTSKLKKHEFSVLVEIISKFSSFSISKHFDIQAFLKSQSKLSNNDRKKIKQYFIYYISLLVDYNIIENKFDVKQNGVNYSYKLSSLTTRNISEGITVYEKLDIN